MSKASIAKFVLFVIVAAVCPFFAVVWGFSIAVDLLKEKDAKNNKD